MSWVQIPLSPNLGYSQVVRHRNLDPTFKGSIPFTPDWVIMHLNKKPLPGAFFTPIFDLDMAHHLGPYALRNVTSNYGIN